MAKKENNVPTTSIDDALQRSSADLASILGDPSLRQDSEDPLQKFIITWWRQLLVVTGAALAIVYAVNTFRETREKDVQSAGDQFFEVQHDFEGFRQVEARLSQARQELAAPGEKKDEDKTKKEIEDLEKSKTDAKRRLDDALTALADARAPYNRLAILYRALVARDTGDSDLLTKTIDPKKWKTITDVKSDDRFFSEIEAVAYARTLLDKSGSDGATKEARELLKDLATDGNYAYVTAALAYSATAQTPEERTDALQLLQRVQAAHVEQDSLLESELKRLKS